MALGVKELEKTLSELLSTYFMLDIQKLKKQREEEQIAAAVVPPRGGGMASSSSTTTGDTSSSKVVELEDGQSIEEIAKSRGALTQSQLEEMERLSGSAIIIEVVLDHKKAPSLGLGWKPSEKEVSRVREGKVTKQPAPDFLAQLADKLLEEKVVKEGAVRVLPEVACEMKFTCLFGVNLS